MNIQQLRAQIAALQDATMDENKNFRSAYDEGKFEALSAVDALLDSMQEEPVSKVWHDPDEEPEVECTIIWEDEKMMGKHLFQGQWSPKIDVFGRKERWCYLSDILDL